jgi:hypothetical protein
MVTVLTCLQQEEPEIRRPQELKYLRRSFNCQPRDECGSKESEGDRGRPYQTSESRESA